MAKAKEVKALSEKVIELAGVIARQKDELYHLRAVESVFEEYTDEMEEDVYFGDEARNVLLRIAVDARAREYKREGSRVAFLDEFDHQVTSGLCGGVACTNPDCYCDEEEDVETESKEVLRSGANRS